MSGQTEKKPVVVQFGAGAIGRGFLAQLWAEAGLETVFVDVNTDLVDAINRDQKYTLQIVTSKYQEEIIIAPVRAISADDIPAVLAELATCTFAATAVGSVLETLVDSFFLPFAQASGTHPRSEPLNVLICENDFSGAETLQRLLETGLKSLGFGATTNTVTFIQAIVGRMVPNPRFSLEAPDGLSVVAEPYKALPVEPNKWQGTFPAAPGLHEQSGFSLYVQRKLYAHNGGHAVLAYHGYRKGHTFVQECAEDSAVVTELVGFWHELNDILEQPLLPRAELEAFEQELVQRFQNHALQDTVVRVARDPIRKLHRENRLVRPTLTYLEKFRKPPKHMIQAIVAALCFDAPNDPSANRLQSLLYEKGVRQAFREIAQIPFDDPCGLVSLVEEAYNTEVRNQAKVGVS